MKRSMFILVFLFLSLELLPVPYNTGMVTWRQPDGFTTFTAQLTGDEFSIKFITGSGYEIREGAGGWFFYAELDGTGKIVPGNLKVGIDAPPQTPPNNLAPAPAIQTEIDQWKLDFQQQLSESDIWYKQKREETSGGTVVLKIGVILVDFEDQPMHYTDELNYPNGYPSQLFNDMLFSQNTYVDPDGSNNIHPENKKVFGSLRDYLNQQSCGKLDITGKMVGNVGQPEILNPPDPDHPDVPQWVYVNGTKEYWNSLKNGLLTDNENQIGVEAYAESYGIQLKNAYGYNIYDRLIFIYAGKNLTGNGLHPSAVPNTKFQMSERWYWNQQYGTFFSHIGVYCHEFGHLLGAHDEYEGSIDASGFKYINPTDWDLMAYGNSKGPESNGECPAGFNPFYKTNWKWVEPQYLNNIDPTEYTIAYNYQSPNYYRLDNPFVPEQYFLIENRLRDGFDEFTPYKVDDGLPPDENDPNGNAGGLLVWTIDERASYGDRVNLLSANGDYIPYVYVYNQYYGAGAAFPYNQIDGYSGINITENTTPNNKIRANGASTKIDFENITWHADTKNISLTITRNFANDFVVVSSNTTWSSSQVINKHLLIMPNTTLTINPGVTLQFDPTKKIIISDNGTLNAVSTGSPIIFTKNGTSNWAGIELYGVESNLIVSSLTIQNATNAITLPKNKSISLSKIDFRNNTSTFSFSGSFENANQIDVRNCKIINSPFSLNNTNNGGLTLNYYNNTFNNAPISTLGNILLTLINNDFKAYGQSSITLSGDKINVIKNNIFHNTIISNTTKGNSLITYNCIYPTPTSQVAALFSDPGNFSADPLFAVPGNLESQSLQQSSPCIDMGDPTMEYTNEPGSNGGRINIGSLGNTTLASAATPNTSRNLSAINMLGNLSLSQSSNWSVTGTCSVGVNKVLEVPNLTVNSSSTLNLSAGVKLNFLNGTPLNVNGTLHATGSSANKITFDFIVPGETAQNGILVNAGGNINISHSNIKNGSLGISVSQAAATIDNCVFTNCNVGIALYGTNNISYPVITNCTLHSNTTNSGFGILASISSPLIMGNDISNYFMGVGVCNFSQADFGNTGNYGNNNIHNNTQGVYEFYNGLPFLGRDVCEIQGGRNILENNTDHNLLVTSNVAVLAENNWWGSDTSNLFKISSTYNTVDYDPWLHELPIQQYANMKLSPEEKLFNNKFDKGDMNNLANEPTVDDVITGSNTSVKEELVSNIISKKEIGNLDVNTQIVPTTLVSNLSLMNRIGYAKRQIDLKHYNTARLIAREIIEKYPDSSASLAALGLLWRASQNDDMTTFKLFVKNLGLKKNKNELNGAAEIIDAGFEKINRADKLNKIITKYKDTKTAEFGYFNLFMYYFFEEGNKGKAKETGDLMTSTFPNSPAALMIKELTNINGKAMVKKTVSSEASTANSSLPTEYKLLGNYPNPFNPSTTISYALPLESNVEINIFDIMGRLIRTFELNGQSAGYQNVLWNGRNENNEQTASGIYLYRFKAVATNGKVFEKTSKLLMLK